MAASNALPTLEAVAAVVSFGGIFLSGVAGRIALHAGVPLPIVKNVVVAGILGAFTLFGCACIGLMIHFFIVLQIRIGNGAQPMVRMMAEHETAVTLAFWAFLALGAALALPFAWSGMVADFQISLVRPAPHAEAPAPIIRHHT